MLIAIFGAIGAPAHSLSQLLALLGRRQFVLWMIGQAILVAAIISSAKSIKYLNPRHSASPRIRLVRGMAYGCISGILSAHSLLVAKSAVELLLCTIFQRDNQFNRWESWVILLGLLALALSQLYYLHRGLKLCSTSVLYPFVFCVYNIIAILDGLIYFHQTSLLSVLDAVLVSEPFSSPSACISSFSAALGFPGLEAKTCQIALGTVILLTGVLALSWRLNADPTVRSPITPKTPLTPGMGVVAPSPTASTLSTTLTPSSPSIISDEETPHQKHALSSYQPHPRIRSRTIGYNPRAPTFIFPNSDSSKHIRPQQQAMTESEEIWEELDDASPLPPLSPFSHQNFSSRHSSAAHRNSVPRLNANNDDITPDGETAPLLSTSRARINTGRTYRERRRRSAPALGEDSTEAAQNAMGGWWQMPWWSGGGSNSRGSGTRADSKIQDENQEREHDADR